MTIHLSNVVASRPHFPSDASVIRPFHHTDFSRSASPVLSVEHFVFTGPVSPSPEQPASCAATLLLEDSTGAIHSRDTAYCKHEIRAGDLHWTRDTESVLRTPQRPEQARLHGLRMMLDLPAAVAAQPVASALIRAGEMPVIQTDAGRIRVVAGSLGGWQSPLATPTALMILDGRLHPGATRLVPLAPGWSAWVYAVQGDLGLRARHRSLDELALPKRPGGDPDFAVLAAGAALVATACVEGEEGLLILMAGRAPAHFVVVAGPALDAAEARGARKATALPGAAAKPKARTRPAIADLVMADAVQAGLAA